MAEIKKSKVKSITPAGTWDTIKEPIQTFYKFEIEMENGDVGEYSSINKSQEKFVEGQEYEYEFTAGKYPKIKPHYKNTNQAKINYQISDNESERIARSVAIKTATDFGINKGMEVPQILELAKIMSDYILKDIQDNSFVTSDDNPF